MNKPSNTLDAKDASKLASIAMKIVVFKKQIPDEFVKETWFIEEPFPRQVLRALAGKRTSVRAKKAAVGLLRWAERVWNG